MGYKTFLAKIAIIYITVLFAAMVILYVFTYPVIQKLYTDYVKYSASQLKTELIRHAKGSVNLTQVNLEVESYEKSLEAAYGLNQPLIVRFALQMKALITFHFGVTPPGVSYPGYTSSNNIAQIIAVALPRTIILFTTGTVIIIAVGTLLGVLAARYQGSAYDKAIPVIAVVHQSLPTWWIGFLLIAGLAYGLRWFPPGGIVSAGLNFSREPLQYVASLLDHMTLPLLAFFIVNVGGFAYVVRSLTLATAKEDFVLTAKARGLPERRIVFGHILKTASPSIATQAMLWLASSFAGGLTTEIVFVWPGVGLLTYNAVLESDEATVMAITYVLTLVLVIALFLNEIIKGLLDPRIRASQG
jgi:peptide/nickel transport system permease protein